MRRATWVWKRPPAGELVPWAVVTLWTSSSSRCDPTSHPVSDVRWAREVVKAAHAAGISVSALGGDADWVDHPEQAWAGRAAVCAMQVFDGVHVDVEPWARTDWDTRRAEVVVGYVDVLRRLAATCPLRLEADLAFWLHEVRTASDTPLDEAVLRLVDAVTLLSFRNVRHRPGQHHRRRSHQSRDSRPARHPVPSGRRDPRPRDRTRCSASRPSSAAGHAAMLRALEVVDAEAARVPSYAGTAVHDQDGWREPSRLGRSVSPADGEG